MIRARLIYNIATLPLPVPPRVINTVLAVALAVALTMAWIALNELIYECFEDVLK